MKESFHIVEKVQVEMNVMKISATDIRKVEVIVIFFKTIRLRVSFCLLDLREFIFRHLIHISACKSY